MEYQKLINLLDNKSNQPSKFKTKNWVKINDESRGTHEEVKFKTSVLWSSLCDYSNAYILVKGYINTVQDQPNKDFNKKVIFKSCAPVSKCIKRTNNTQVDDAPDIDVVMPIYNLIEYNDNYSKTSGILWQYCRDEPA